MSGNVVEGSFIGAHSYIVDLSALSWIIWIYFFRNWASLTKLAVWVEFRSIGAAIDRLAVMIHLIQITLSLTFLAPSACPIVKLQSTKHASLTDDRVIDHLLLAQAFRTRASDYVEKLIDVAGSAVLCPKVEHVVIGAVEADLFFEPDKGSFDGATGQIISRTSFEHQYLVVTLGSRSIEPVISCQIILRITFADIHNSQSLLIQLLRAVVSIKRAIDNSEVIPGQIDHLIDISNDELTIYAFCIPLTHLSFLLLSVGHISIDLRTIEGGYPRTSAIFTHDQEIVLE